MVFSAIFFSDSERVNQLEKENKKLRLKVRDLQTVNHMHLSIVLFIDFSFFQKLKVKAKKSEKTAKRLKKVNEAKETLFREQNSAFVEIRGFIQLRGKFKQNNVDVLAINHGRL